MDTVKTMVGVTKGMVPVLMGVRVTGRERGVTVRRIQIVKRHIRSCVWLDTLITVSALKRLTLIHKTHNMSYYSENATLCDLFSIILEKWLQFRKISLIVKNNF